MTIYARAFVAELTGETRETREIRTTHTDAWGREFPSAEAALAARPVSVSERGIWFGDRYFGQLTQWRGRGQDMGLDRMWKGGWTHSLQLHGSEPFTSAEVAEADFWRAKSALTRSLHQAIFGYDRSGS